MTQFLDAVCPHAWLCSCSCQILDPEHQSQGDSKEGYYIGREVSADSEETKWPLHGPNQWPDPSALPTWRPVMERYFSALQDLGLRIVRLMCRALGLPPDHLDPLFTRPLAALRLLHYNDQVGPHLHHLRRVCAAGSGLALTTMGVGVVGGGRCRTRTRASMGPAHTATMACE